MTVIINKVLAGQEDLAIGLGTSTQIRQNHSVVVKNIGLYWLFESISDITALDARYTHAMLVSGSSTTPYYYDATSSATPDGTNVLLPNSGIGR